ncbi:hypothetical protein B1H58_06740 [Pantoea alhagi]|uniref:Uncharacterized protein n=1 Tax=Pantoea alhagi TaxID=1891675 RepID=A0A1W6B3T7_9GAMM|nr:hypothetical protein [Pantoea alhagi]ARJ41748.1 hypothetical protein B1H58_06740 [Pantoea alhagi]
MIRTILLAMTFLWIFNAYATINNDKNSTEEASCLTKKYVASNNENIKKTLLTKLSSLSDSNPDNINIIRMYSGLLASGGKYKKAISVLEPFNQKHKNASLLLQECMLKDRIGNYEPSCYKKVIALKRASGINDTDYLMALFMISDKDFSQEKNLYMQGRDDNHDLEAFNHKKEKLLKIFYPN